jgi:hypothetical protein
MVLRGMYGEVDTARRVRRGGAIELRASRLVLVGASALALAGCRSATAPVPPVPEKVFSFEARNEIQQTGADPVDAGNAQVGVMFSVSLPDSVSPADLAKIQQVDVLWPNKYVRTPILGGFQVNGDSLTASQLLADRTDGLPKGFYTLEVQFTDGQKITKTQYCDGALLMGPDIQSFTVDSTGLQLAWWILPITGQTHTWRMYLERVQPPPDTVLLSLPGDTATGNDHMTEAFDYAFQPDEAYALVMDMENTCNHREVRIPIA